MTSFSGVVTLATLLFLGSVLQVATASISDQCTSHESFERLDVHEYILRSPREEKPFAVKTLEVVEVLVYIFTQPGGLAVLLLFTIASSVPSYFFPRKKEKIRD
ncbi:MAG: hypothetical protein BVN35_05930 [Proteobacteria bacterium ST_bin11]|nr:MAG: hypothetical protein BVN35_05930 [Proteobacteria bacterium ST_bin11]